MAPPAPVTNLALKSILEKAKLNGTNFTTWYRNLRIVLKRDKKENVLKEPLPEEPADDATAAAKNANQKDHLPDAGFNGARAATAVIRH